MSRAVAIASPRFPIRSRVAMEAPASRPTAPLPSPSYRERRGGCYPEDSARANQRESCIFCSLPNDFSLRGLPGQPLPLYQPIPFQAEPALAQPSRPSRARADPARLVQQAVPFFLGGQPGELGVERVLGLQEIFLAVQDRWV